MSSVEAVVVADGSTPLAQLMLPKNGKNFPLWKMKMLGKLEAGELNEVVEYPIADSEDQVHAMLKCKPSDEVELARVVEKFAGLNAVSVPVPAPAVVGSATSSDSSSIPVSGDDAAKKLTKGQLKELIAAAKERVKKSRKAYSILISCLPDDILQLVQGNVVSGDAHGVWKLLLSKFERNTIASRHQCRGKLHKCKMERGESFDSYLGRLTEIELRLKQMGASVPEDEKLFVMLEGLPPAFELLVHSLQMKGDLTIDEAAEHIRDFQERKNITKEKAEDTAHYVQSQRGNYGGGGRPRQMIQQVTRPQVMSVPQNNSSSTSSDVLSPM